MNPVDRSPEARRGDESRGVRSLLTRLTNVVLANLLRVVRFLGRALEGSPPNF